MADAFTFELVSPERLLLSEQVTQVIVPGADGYMTIMANHAPLMSTLQPGLATVKTVDGKEEAYVIFGGFIDVMQTSCTVLAEEAMPISEMNKEELDKRIEMARKAHDEAAEGEAKAISHSYLGQLTTLQGAILPV